jgi:hypothetical protein
MGRQIRVLAVALGGLLLAAVGVAVPAHALGGPTDAGYEASHAGVSYHQVSADWTVPKATCLAQDGYVSTWVGLDGYSTPTVEQAGVLAYCTGGTVAYEGWYELYPAYPVYVTNPISAGDAVTATVTASGTDAFTFTLTDTTRGWTHTAHATGTAQLGSAEIVNEYIDASFPAFRVTDALVNSASLELADPTAIGRVSVIGADGRSFTIDGVS